MAKVGLSHLMCCPIKDDGTLGDGKQIAKAIKIDVKVNINDAKMHADNGIAESVKEFKDGSITAEMDDIGHEMTAELLGSKMTELGELISNENDIPPFEVVAYIAKKIVKNKRYFVGIAYQKVQFGVPDDSLESTGENIVLKSSTIVGTLYRNAKGDWRIMSKPYMTLEEAVAWVHKQVNFAMLTVTSQEGETTGKTKLVIEPPKASENSYKYLIGNTLDLPNVGDIIADTYTEWNGVAEIAVTAEKEIIVVEVDSTNRVVKRGKNTIVAKENAGA